MLGYGRAVKLACALLAALAGAAALAPAAGAAAHRNYWFRVSRVQIDVTATESGSETDDFGTTTSGHATRTGSIDYHGRRGDLASYIEVPRHIAYHGSIETNRVMPMDVHQSGSWTVTSQDGTQSGTCHGDQRIRPAELYTTFNPSGRQVHGTIAAPISQIEFNDDCALRPEFDSPKMRWSLPASALHRRTVKIRFGHEAHQSGGISWSSVWSGTITLKRLVICRVSRCDARVR